MKLTVVCQANTQLNIKVIDIQINNNNNNNINNNKHNI